MNAIASANHLRRSRPQRGAHRPSVALILLATVVQIIAMAALLGSVARIVQ